MNPSLKNLIQDLSVLPVASDDELAHILKKALYQFEKASNRVPDPVALSDLMADFISSVKGKEESFSLPWMDIFNNPLDLVPGELVILAARPGVGKTTTLINMAMHWSSPLPNLSENITNLAQSLDMLEDRKQWPVLYYTLESTVQQFTRHAYKIISVKNIDDSTQYTAEDHAALLSGYKFYIEDKLFSNISLMRADIEENIQRYDIRIVIVDYLQLLSSGKHKNNREQEVGYIVRQLQSIARENNVLVLVSSQLSRAVEYRSGDKRPMLSDLRESGHIEQIADKVILLYRPDIYGFYEDANGDSIKNMIELIIAKNRSGSTGSLKLHVDRDTLNILDTYKDEIERSQWRIPSDRLSELF